MVEHVSLDEMTPDVTVLSVTKETDVTNAQKDSREKDAGIAQKDSQETTVMHALMVTMVTIVMSIINIHITP